MRRKIAIVLLSLGTLVGYGSGFASLACHRRARQRAFEQHVAQVCVNAAQNTLRQQGFAPTQAPPQVPSR